ASSADFLNLLQKAPRLQMVQVPPSYMRTMSKAIEAFLRIQGVKLLEGDVWGHRKDLDEYLTIEDAVIREIRSLSDSGKAIDSIANKARISPLLIKFIAGTNATA
ncbi:MAG: DUF1699 family protein, partial [Methanothrix sp.]|nr:DUF1699 family protein [Methanothrix sp.]